jgi:5-methylcytosine-specific restriction endonuclease McrA
MSTCRSCRQECPENRYDEERDEYCCEDCERDYKKMDYAEYLRSVRWMETRNKKLQQVRELCERCGQYICLQVHHKTYVRRGHELMSDLEVLCSWCHRKEHGK